MRRIFNYPFLAIAALLLGMVTFGTIGYMLIEGWSLLEALYMTTITMSTIGYGEVKTLSAGGRMFTIGLIVIGVITASYAITATVNLITSQEFLEQIRSHRRNRALSKISDHCIVCGFGRLGRSLSRELQARDFSVIVVDIAAEAVEECHRKRLAAIQGSGADERILHQAGIERAKSLVAAANSDAENVFIVLTAKSINPNLQVITRCNAEGSIPKLEKAGADTVISPYATTGRRIAQILIHPKVTSFLDGILDFGDQQMRLEEFVISQNSPLANLTLSEAKLNVAVLAVTHPDQTLLAHPNANTKLLSGSAIIVMGVNQALEELAQLVQG